MSYRRACSTANSMSASNINSSVVVAARNHHQIASIYAERWRSWIGFSGLVSTSQFRCLGTSSTRLVPSFSSQAGENVPDARPSEHPRSGDSAMYVRVVSFGSNWWEMHFARPGRPLVLQTKSGLVQSAALHCGRRIRYFAAFPGQIRFNMTSGFNPEFPTRALGRIFVCSGQTNMEERRTFLRPIDFVRRAPMPGWSVVEFWRSPARSSSRNLVGSNT